MPQSAAGWRRVVQQGHLQQGIGRVAQGYTAAKMPAEAMDQFRTAIQARNYKNAAYYCTKDYAEYLTRTHAGAAELGADIDQIRAFGDKDGIVSDKLQIILHKLDPFPLNFKVGPVPKETAKGKTFGSFEWQLLNLKNPGMLTQAQLATDAKDLAGRCSTTFLARPTYSRKASNWSRRGKSGNSASRRPRCGTPASATSWPSTRLTTPACTSSRSTWATALRFLKQVRRGDHRQVAQRCQIAK
ncbi:MAG: hypothetical protein EXR98_11435 [Gemmataceae bacterium]|nr:hypothetical protein [Gemmataceae bacterium]